MKHFITLTVTVDLKLASANVNYGITHLINQSINQTSIVPISPAKPGSVFNSKIEKTVVHVIQLFDIFPYFQPTQPEDKDQFTHKVIYDAQCSRLT